MLDPVRGATGAEAALDGGEHHVADVGAGDARARHRDVGDDLAVEGVDERALSAIGPRTMIERDADLLAVPTGDLEGVGTPAQVRCHHRDAAVVDTSLASSGGALQRQAMLAENARATRLRLTGFDPALRRSRFSSAVRRR